MLRIINEVKPTWVIAENVAGIVGMAFDTVSLKLESKTLTRDENYDYFNNVLTRQETMCLDQVCKNLEEINYSVQPIIIPACAVGGIHRRDRVWIVANSSSEGANGHAERKTEEHSVLGNSRENAANSESVKNRGLCREGIQPINRVISIPKGSGSIKPSTSKQAKRQRNEPREKNLSNVMANAYSKRSQRKPITEINESVRKKPNVKQFAGCNSSQLFRPIEPPTQCPVRSRDDGIPENVARLKALGNAVVPQIPEIIGRAIIKLITHS